MKNGFLFVPLVCGLLASTALQVQASGQEAPKVTCSAMKARFYPIEFGVFYNNIRGKVDEIFAQGACQPLGDNCFLWTQNLPEDVQVSVAGCLDRGTRKLLAANIIAHHPNINEHLYPKPRQATIMATTHSAREGLDCSYTAENLQLLKNIAAHFTTSESRAAYDCRRTEIDGDFTAAGFGSSGALGLLLPSILSSQFRVEKPYCPVENCWQWQGCSVHKQ